MAAVAEAGDPVRAAAMWQGIDVGDGQLDARAWWYGHIGDEAAVSGMAAARSILQGK